MKLNKLYWLLLVFMMSSVGMAKGLDEITAESPAPEPETVSEGTPAKADTPAAEAPKAEEKPATEEKAAEKPAETPPAPPPRSALSEKLNNKLALVAGASIGSFSSSKGDWASGGGGDMQLTWLRADSFLGKPWPLHLTFRYSPYDVTTEVDQQAYKGTVQGYNFGVMTYVPWKDKVNWVAQAELGYIYSNLSSTDLFTEKSSAETKGMEITLTGGADWTMLEKLRVGPRLGIGMGAFSMVRLGASAAFVF